MSKKKIIRNVILVLAILIILIILLTQIGDIKAIGNTLATQTNPWYIVLSVVIVLVYCFINQLSLVILVRHKYKDILFSTASFISGSEFFFNAITPFSSGGQPFQAYSLKRKGMKLSDSTSALMLNFLAYQVVLTIFSLVFIVIYYNRLSKQVDDVAWLVIVGFAINAFVMILILLLGLTKFAGNFLIKIMDVLCKIKIVNKFLGAKKEDFRVYVEEMQTAFKEISKSKRIWFLCVLTKVVAIFIYYAIPYFAFLSIGEDLGFHDICYVVAVTTFSLSIAIWIPTPGSSGGAETMFTVFFVGMLPSFINGALDEEGAKNLALSGMLVWRMLTYYLLIIYGFIMYMLSERGDKDESGVVH